MSETLSLPVLPLDDTVVLPSMVVPVEMSDTEVRGAIEAAQMAASAPGATSGTGAASTGSKPQVVLVPRLGGKYSAVGTLGVVEQTGRLPSGELAAVIRGLSRVRIGTGTVGPGAALWVEGTVERAGRQRRGPRSWPASTAGWPRRSCRSAVPGRSSTRCSGSRTRRRWPTARATPRT